jgi:hypothetical protein
MLSFNLKFDDAVVKTFSAASGSKNWVQMMGTVTVSDEGPHTISLDVATKGKSGDIFSVDDFSITAVSPPAGTKFCTRK